MWGASREKYLISEVEPYDIKMEANYDSGSATRQETDEDIEKDELDYEDGSVNEGPVEFCGSRRGYCCFVESAVGKFGQFFGVTESGKLQEWKTREERKLRKGDFGLSLKASQKQSETAFHADVRKVLSQIDQAEKSEARKIVRAKSIANPREYLISKHFGVADGARPKLRRVTSSSTSVVFNRSSFRDDSQTMEGSIQRDRKGSKRSSVPCGTRHEQPFETEATTVHTFRRSSLSTVDLSRKLSIIETINEEEDIFYDAEDGIEVVELDDVKVDTIDELKDNEQEKPSTFISTFNPAFEETDEGEVDGDDFGNFGSKRLAYQGISSNTSLQTDVLFDLLENMDENEETAIKPEEMIRTLDDMSRADNESVPCSAERERSSEILQQPAKTQDDLQKNSDPLSVRENVDSAELAYGEDGCAQYQLYIQLEKEAKKRELEIELTEQMTKYDWKIQALDDLVELARDYYLNPNKKSVSQWRELKRRVNRRSCTEMRRKMDSLPEYKPIFTIFIIVAQLISFTVIFALGGLTYIGVTPELSLGMGVQTFMGLETVHRWIPPNLWIGPSQPHIVSVGGVFAPCMRQDIEIQLMYSRSNYSMHKPLGCCEVKSRNTAGTTTQAECQYLTAGAGHWRGSHTCANRPVELTSVRHVLKPCCVGMKGQCQLLSHAHCTFLEGHFQRSGAEHCSQVCCLQHVCSLGSLTSSKSRPWSPESPSQWWRLPLSLLYHQGVIQLLLVSAVQGILLTKIERTAGWLRMLIIYLVSGTAALLTSSFFTPYQSHVGGVGAVFGMVGVTLVELIQFWKTVPSPGKELAKIVTALCVFLVCGTLPYMDIFGMLSGLIFGALTGIIVLPYINFGAWQIRMRIVLIATALPVLAMCTFAVMQLFLSVQTVNNCKACRWINCIPYTETMCDTTMWQL